MDGDVVEPFQRLKRMRVLPLLPVADGAVRIRPLDHGDAVGYARGSADDEVRRFGHLPLDEYTEQVVRDQIDGPIATGLSDGTLAVLAIADEATDEFLGSIVLFDPRPDRAEVGFWLAPWARGRGHAVAALRAVCEVAAAVGLDYLEAKTNPENLGSRRVLDRCGFEQAGEPHVETAPSGRATTLVTFERALVEFRVNV